MPTMPFLKPRSLASIMPAISGGRDTTPSLAFIKPEKGLNKERRRKRNRNRGRKTREKDVPQLRLCLQSTNSQTKKKTKGKTEQKKKHKFREKKRREGRGEQELGCSALSPSLECKQIKNRGAAGVDQFSHLSLASLHQVSNSQRSKARRT